MRAKLVNENLRMDLGLDLYNRLKRLIPDIKANMDDNGNIYIPYATSTSEQREIIWEEFDEEDVDYFVTDDAGPNDDSIGIIVEKGTEHEF